MSKLKITRKQQDALKYYLESVRSHEYLHYFIKYRDDWVDSFKSIKNFSVDEFAKLLYVEDSYEIDFEYKVGDIAVRTVETNDNGRHRNVGYTFKITEVMKTAVSCSVGMHLIDNIRPATEEEVKDFEKWGSVKEGDILIHANVPVFFVEDRGGRIYYKLTVDGRLRNDDKRVFTVYDNA